MKTNESHTRRFHLPLINHFNEAYRVMHFSDLNCAFVMCCVNRMIDMKMEKKKNSELIFITLYSMKVFPRHSLSASDKIAATISVWIDKYPRVNLRILDYIGPSVVRSQSVKWKFSIQFFFLLISFRLILHTKTNWNWLRNSISDGHN